MGSIKIGTEVLIIGGGPGGYVAAERAAQFGKDVVLVEWEELGGTCLNHGCIPSKALISVGDLLWKVKESQERGVTLNGTIDIDFGKTQDWKQNKVIKRLTSGVATLMKAGQVEVVKGKAKFVDDHTVEVALNEGGAAQDLRSGVRLFQIQTAEKIPTRIVLTARGTAGHASLPRSDNAIVHLARALVRLENDQPVRLNQTTRRYFARIAALPDYRWLAPLVPKLESYSTAYSAAAQIRAREPELDAQLRTTISPTMLSGGLKINVIPNTAEASVDVRRLPNESDEEVLVRQGSGGGIDLA
jgi:hypothetical protein